MRLLWQQIPSTVVTDILCQNNLDGVVLDTEHGCFNNETLYNCVQLITANSKKCFVRLTEANKTRIRFCLDAGANGLIFSTVETEKQSQNIHEMCKYPNHGGGRGLGLVKQNRWGEDNLLSDPPMIVAQIETNRGIKNLEKIFKYNFDFYMIGPYDLSLSLGVPGQFENEKYLSAIQKIRELIPLNKMSIHIPKHIETQINKYKDYGMIALGMDTIILLEGGKDIQNARY